MAADANLNHEALRPRDMPSVLSTCVPCPAGRVCPGATGCAFGANMNDCPPKITCAAGTFWDAETAACLPCAADNYKVRAAATRSPHEPTPACTALAPPPPPRPSPRLY